MRGRGGGLKLGKNARKQLSPHLRKKTGHNMFPYILYFFIHSQSNNIGLARQQPRDLGSLNFSESGRGSGGGAQLLLISCATTRLPGICNGSIDGMEDGGHTLQPRSLGTGDKCSPQTHHKVLSFLGLGRGTKVFNPP